MLKPRPTPAFTLGFTFFTVLLVGLAPSSSPAQPDRRDPHLRWRALHDTPPVYERWFIPTDLGHEPGSPAPEPGPHAFLTRHLWASTNEDNGEWARRNHTARGLFFSHNLSRIFPLDLFDQHPEFFPMIQGERRRPAPGRPSWNPDLGEPSVALHAAEAARAYFSANPDQPSFAVGTNDGLRFGESPATLHWVLPMRYFRQRPDFSNLVFQFTNRVAEEIAEDHPDKYIGALAYYWSENTPDFPLHPRVIPFLTADRSQGYDRAFRREEERLQRAWARSGAERLGIYDYIYGTGFVIPRLHPALLARHLRHARRVGFTDYFAEMGPNWGLDGPQPWLVAQLLQNPRQSHRRLLDEYYTRYFRAAAGPMRAFYEGCEALWLAQEGPSFWLKHYRFDTQAAVFPSNACAELRAHLDAARLASAGDDVATARVALVEDAFSATEAFVTMVEDRQALARAIMQVTRGERRATDLRPLRHASRLSRDAFALRFNELRTSQPLALSRRGRIEDYQLSDWTRSADWLLGEFSFTPRRQLLDHLRWEGPVPPDLTIAGLVYEPGLPGRWKARTEPFEGLLTTVLDDPEQPGRVLRLENHKTSFIQQTVRLPGPGRGLFSVLFRGHLSVGSELQIQVGWHQADGAALGGSARINLPPGHHPRDSLLPFPLVPPEGAAYASLIIAVYHQQQGDWIELRKPNFEWDR